MPTKIHVLPDSVARKIAAGEVIERPASVVKELVENSLDAGARRIVVELEHGGRTRIAVTDDGEGMSREDAIVAFEPHATSKIRDAEDLDRISTLGFRGEALPSIAAVSEVELWTCRRVDDVGTRLRVVNGAVASAEDFGTAAGARFEVRELFSPTPARRKFLKSPPTEAGHVGQLVARFGLAHPGIAFVLRHDDRDVLSLPPATRRDRVRRILGAEVEREMRPVERDGAVRVSGFISQPNHSVASSRAIHFFVNGRSVRDRLLQHALMAAYATMLPSGRYPAAVVFVDLPPEEVDVNVHPTKLEVRFRSAQAVHEAIGRAVRDALASRSTPARAAQAAESSPVYATGVESLDTGAAAPLRLVPLAERESTLPFQEARLFSSLRVVGQLFDGYVVCEGDGELVLVDQHAAHERVAFERLRAASANRRIEAQPMLVPQPIELVVGEVELLTAASADLAACGLEIEPFGDRAVVVRSTPALLPSQAIGAVVRAIATDLADGDRSRALEARTERLLATIACHSVVRVGQRLSEIEMRALLESMDSIELNASCPHGRPVARRISRGELERRFGR